MIGTIASKVNHALCIEEATTLNYSIDEGQVFMALTQSAGIPSEFARLPGIGHAIKEISQARRLTAINIMINRLEPGKAVPKHRDWIKPTPLQPKNPCIERWHLALETNDYCFWWDEFHDRVEFPIGLWSGPVPYWKLHTFVNNGSSSRLHLVIDLDTPEPVGSYE